MRPEVLVQVVRSHKLLAALGALEALLPCMGSSVSLQLIGPGEPFTAVHPLADEGTFSWNPNQKLISH